MSESKTLETVPFSLRLRVDEHMALKRDAAGMSMAAYVREKLFGASHQPRKTRGKFPVKDQRALGRVLGRLGTSEIGTNLEVLAAAARSGCLIVDPRIEADLTRACGDISIMRAELMKALGVREKEPRRDLKPEFKRAADA